MSNKWLIAALWMALALCAGVVSMQTAISVSLLEIVAGAFGGNFLHLQTTPWIDFLAGFGSVLLTFMAGAEIEPAVLRRHLVESIGIGLISFALPFAATLGYAYYVAHWSLPAAKIAGVALSTTSVAVVYAVMVETGLNETELGKTILAACFITDLGTVVALGVLFASFNLWMGIFVGCSILVLAMTPSFSRWFFGRFGGHISELETKLVFLLLFGLGGLAVQAESEAVLPAYVLGLVMASMLSENKEMIRHLRTTVFALLTPFYFLKAGMLISFRELLNGAGMIMIFLGIKVAAKAIGVWPVARAFRFTPRVSTYTTLLMSTGLTFGSISALFGFTRGFINQGQYTILVTAVIGSAIVPTLIAQSFFRPEESEA